MPTLPLPNKFLLSLLLKLFVNDEFNLEDILIEVNTIIFSTHKATHHIIVSKNIIWMELLGYYVLKQQNANEQACLWRDHVGSMLVHYMLNNMEVSK